MANKSTSKPELIIQTLRAVYTGTTDEAGNKVLIQTPNSSNPGLDELLAIKNDFEITRHLNFEGVLKSRELRRTSNAIEIVKDYFNGITLSDFLKSHTLSTQQFLEIAIHLSKIIGKLHELKIIHKDLHPDHILISEDGKKLCIANFGIATQLAQEQQELRLNESLKGTLTHISPEQTGRMNRSIDYRSDLYSLGVTLYQALCQKLPFEFTEIIELVHAHIARYPIEPIKVNSGIPQPVSAIVMKLLAKNAEDRYQSIAGLVYDLEFCLKEWTENQSINDFEIATNDFSPVLNISEKLYGRQVEIEKLVKSFERSTQNTPEMILVAGYSGIGKTRLINEIDMPIAAKNGYFSTGKFDQYNRDTPYSAISQALGSLIRQFLSESEVNINRWRAAITSALGHDGQVLVDVIPELELLIGKQEPVLKLGLNETNLRFVTLFQKFLMAISGNGQAVVLFIDDLQWADSGSFDILYKTLTNSSLHNVFLIGAYRDNEVSPSHPLMLLIEKLNKEVPGKVDTIVLNELDKEQVNQFVADSLRQNPKSTHELTGLIMSKTQGNPFFIKQFIKKLGDEGLIFFNSKHMHWSWNAEGISHMDVTDNVVDLLVVKINKLSEVAQKVLQLASCIGNSFDIKTLAIISELPEHTLSEVLWEIVTDGFITPRNKWSRHAKDVLWKEINIEASESGYDHFQFQHDRIQQAAYSLIAIPDRKKTHLQIGRLLLQKLKSQTQQEYLFDTLSHLNYSIELITDPEEKKLIATLNHQAGEKAKRSNSYQPALTFLKAGMDLLEDDQATDLFKTILLTRSETEYLCGHHQESEKLFDQALKNAKSNLEKAPILAAKMSLYENTNRQLEAIKIALEGLRAVGVHLPEKPGTVNVLVELVKAKYYLRNKSIVDLKNNKNMDSAELLIAMKILVNLWGPAYLYNQNLLALAILRMVSLSARFGNCPESALAYAFYGFVLCAQLKDYTNGHEFGKLGVWLNEKFEDKTLKSKVYVIYGGCVAHWSVPYYKLLDNLYKAHEVGVESNDLIYASYAFSFYGKTKFFNGDNLVETRNLVDKFVQFTRQIQYPLNINYMLSLARPLYQLTGATPDPNIFEDSVDIDVHLKQMEDIAAKDGTTLFLATFHAYQGMVSYHLCNYEDSINQFKSFKKYIESVAGQSDLIVGEFYRAMALLAAASQGKSLGFKDRSIIQYSIKFFKKISATCPDNFKAMYLLLLAEQASNKKDFRRAESLYSQARNTAKEFKNTNYSALANERSGRFYLQNNLTDIAAKFIETSYQYYAEWGAFKKLSAFIEEFPQIDFSKLVNKTIDDDKLETFADSSSESLDLQSIFKASTTISGEIVFEKLLEKLLKIIIENAGAQRVFLIMTDNGQLKAEAYGSFEQPVELLKSKPLDSVEGLAHTLVQLVFHTGETIILNDAANDNRFAKDKYIQSVKPKSVLGLPIKQHGKILAILYLENSIASGAFTPARLELLNLLSGQMAISLENALLYDNLEQKVIERTQTIEQQKMELEAEKEKSDTLLLNILPFETAEELKRTGSYKPRKYDNVSIVFTDFEGFTTISEKLTTEELVDMIDYCYKGFDLITSKHNIEKIKTIGDAYMCVSGLPVSNSEHASNAVNAAIEMLEFIEEFNADRKTKNQPYCRIRIGIHTGPVAAGVVGSKKFAYDIWGDSVNVAARLESAAEGGKINISNSTYELIKDRYHCVHRGKINVKNKGEIDMYFVNKLPENANMTGTL